MAEDIEYNIEKNKYFWFLGTVANFDKSFLFSDWDTATLSNESLLDTVSRFVLAALLKHTSLLSQACGESRQVTQSCY